MPRLTSPFRLSLFCVLSLCASTASAAFTYRTSVGDDGVFCAASSAPATPIVEPHSMVPGNETTVEHLRMVVAGSGLTAALLVAALEPPMLLGRCHTYLSELLPFPIPWKLLRPPRADHIDTVFV